jgi:hypothetical protein
LVEKWLILVEKLKFFVKNNNGGPLGREKILDFFYLENKAI